MLKRKKYIILSVVVFSMICCVVIFMYKINLEVKSNPPRPMIYHDGMKFVFVGNSEKLNEDEVVEVGTVKKEVNGFPSNESEAFNIDVGTKFYVLSQNSDKIELVGYIFIRDKSEYRVGYLYYGNDAEQEEITEYFEKKENEHKNNQIKIK